MAALTTMQARREVRGTFKVYTLAMGNKCFQGGAIMLNTATQKVVSGSNAAAVGLIFLGYATENVDATLADAPVNVNLIDETTLTYWDNGTGGDAVAATDLGQNAYALDDHTVSILASGKSVVGIIKDVSATYGVGVEKVRGRAASILASNPTAPAFVAGDMVLTTVANGAMYDVPTTAAASTITLPAAAADGTMARFMADGVKNGHTVQYRDATGPAVLTTALLALKRHVVTVSKLNGKWFANAYVSP